MKKKKRSKRLIQSRGSIRNEEPRGTRSSFDYWTWMCNAASSLPIEASISSAQYLGSPLRPYYFSEPFLFFDIFHLLLFFSFSFFNILVPRNIRSHDVGRSGSSTAPRRIAFQRYQRVILSFELHSIEGGVDFRLLAPAVRVTRVVQIAHNL